MNALHELGALVGGTARHGTFLLYTMLSDVAWLGGWMKDYKVAMQIFLLMINSIVHVPTLLLE